MTTETTTELVVETATQPTIQVPMEAKPDVPGTIPSSYAGYPGVHYMDPVTKKQKQDALWDSDGKDPISKETLFEPQFDHHISTKISSDPQKVSVVNKDTNILKSGMTEEFAKDLIAYNKKVRKEANSKDKKVRKEVNSKDKKLKRCAKKRPL